MCLGVDEGKAFTAHHTALHSDIVVVFQVLLGVVVAAFKTQTKEKKVRIINLIVPEKLTAVVL